MSESTDSVSTDVPAGGFESPPLSPMPVRDAGDAARSRLHELAAELARSHNRRLLVEYLQIRRSLR